MKRDYTLIQVLGFSVTSVLGTLLHFVYEWTDNNAIAGLFSAVNESTWEHMKLLFFPLFLVAILQNKLLGSQPNFWCIKLLGTLAGVLSIPIIFYAYNGAVGKSPDWVNISIFFMAAAISFWLETRLFKSRQSICYHTNFCFFRLCFMGLIFFLFTFWPPHIPLFLDPVTQTYGITR